MRRSRHLLHVLAALWLLAGLGCHGAGVDEEPETLVQEFLYRMQRVHGDPKAARAAFELLWAPAQKNLTERATRASALAGRKVAPEEMLAPTRFSLRFEPKRLHATVDGDVATVLVSGEPSSHQQEQVRCVREQGRWRVVLDLPPLAPIHKRPDAVVEE